MYKVLIVDDEPLVRASIRGLGDWENQGFDLTVEARNGREALDCLDREDFDIVLLDMNMPRCNGICFLRELRQRELWPAVIIISAFDEFSLVREAFTLGAMDYLLKADISFDKVRDLLVQAAATIDKQQERTPKHLVDERLRQQILLDMLSSSRPLEFQVLLDELGVSIPYPCLPIQFRLQRENETVQQFLRSSLESRSDGLFIALTGSDSIWLYTGKQRGKLSIVEEADLLARELSELVKVSFNADLERALGEPVVSVEDFPAAMETLGRLFSNSSRPVHRAKAFITSNYSNPGLTLAMTADYAGVSRTHLSSLFSRELGQGFSDYLIQVRIDAARELLSGSTCKVYEVAEAVGYGSVEQFSRMFKRITGTSPNRFQAGSSGNR